MRSRRVPYAPPPDERDKKIARLECALYLARSRILELCPERFHDSLQSYRFCKTRAESHRWENEVTEKILDGAELLPEDRHSQIFGRRAYCPLCRRGSSSPYEKGFSYPEGLRRHLVGYGRTHACAVMEAVMELARDRWHDQFSAGEAEEEKLKAQKQAERRNSEPLYRLGPKDDPVLLDEGFLWRGVRQPDGPEFSLRWAEERLASLGFQMNSDGMTRSYTKSVKHGDRELIVYADPRQVGHISFRVFDPAGPRRRQLRSPAAAFEIRDSWKNRLDEKVAAGVAAALAVI
jgi:hypothetical protein